MSELFWVVDDDEWRITEGTIAKDIKPGLYELAVEQPGPFSPALNVCLRRIELNADKLLELPGSLSSYVMGVVNTFLSSREKYKQMGLLHKRGILLEGPPGSGKTATCMLVGHRIGKEGGISVFVPAGTKILPLPDVLKAIRKMHPDLFIANIMEDIDKHNRYIDHILPMLDGEMQIDKVMHIATTNFVDKIDARLTNRPSRFDEVIRSRPPLKKEREAYIRTLFADPTAIPGLAQMVSASKGLQYAHVKEVAIATHIYGRDPVKTAAKMRELAENKGTGFGADNDEDE
jgi:SpoVK/Ycf46/Vps4 family AAA+-type ATPase